MLACLTPRVSFCCPATTVTYFPFSNPSLNSTHNKVFGLDLGSEYLASELNHNGHTQPNVVKRGKPRQTQETFEETFAEAKSHRQSDRLFAAAVPSTRPRLPLCLYRQHVVFHCFIQAGDRASGARIDQRHHSQALSVSSLRETDYLDHGPAPTSGVPFRLPGAGFRVGQNRQHRRDIKGGDSVSDATCGSPAAQTFSHNYSLTAKHSAVQDENH